MWLPLTEGEIQALYVTVKEYAQGARHDDVEPALPPVWRGSTEPEKMGLSVLPASLRAEQQSPVAAA
jgi:hypothetical protein